jgi:hypothetical protein
MFQNTDKKNLMENGYPVYTQEELQDMRAELTGEEYFVELRRQGGNNFEYKIDFDYPELIKALLEFKKTYC